MGETQKTDSAELFAGAFMKAVGESPDAVLKVHNDLNEEGEEAYRAAWSLMNSKTRAAVKKALGK